MEFTIVARFKANKREIPGNLPPLLWHEKAVEYRDDPETLNLAWYDPALEYLSPAELATIRAKARVWWEMTGAYPRDISCWWEVRAARRRGDIPHSNEWADATVDTDGVLHCGKCGARWSPNRDGSPHTARCKLCDVRWIIKTSDAQQQGYSIPKR